MGTSETLHRPADFVSLAREARALAALGLAVLDIASALDVHPEQVRKWTSAPPADAII